MVVASKLRAYGIEPLIPDWHILSNDPRLLTALGGIRIWVPQIDLQEAVEIIDEAPCDDEKRNGRLSESRKLHFFLAIILTFFGAVPAPRVRISLHKSARPR